MSRYTLVLKAHKDLSTIKVQSRFYYRDLDNLAVATNESAAALATAFIGTVYSALQTVVHEFTVYDEVVVTPHNTDIQVVDTSIAGNIGARLGGGMLPFDAMKFKLVRKQTTVRSGSKRFGLVAENDFTDTGKPVNGAIQASLDVVSSTLIATITDGAFSFIPVLLGYSYATGTPVETGISFISSAPFIEVTSQLTRKR